MRFAVLAGLSALLVACAGMRAVDIERAMNEFPPQQLRHGSLVELRTLDGRRARFRVTDLLPEGVGGDAGFFPYRNLEWLRVETQGDGNALAVILGVLGVAALIALISAADDVSICSPSPCPAGPN